MAYVPFGVSWFQVLYLILSFILSLFFIYGVRKWFSGLVSFFSMYLSSFFPTPPFMEETVSTTLYIQFLHSEGNRHKAERQPTQREKIFANDSLIWG